MGIYDNYLKAKKLGWESDSDPFMGMQNQIPPIKSESLVFKENALKAGHTLSPQSPTPSSFWGKLDSASGALGAAGSILGGIGSIYDAIAKDRYQKKIFNIEKERVDRALKREGEAKNILSSVWGK